MSQPQSMEPGTATGVSAGTLFYLWGDQLVEPAGKLGGTTLPSGTKVSAKQLAPLLFAVSFARLQADGALRMEERTTKTLGIKRHHVQVSPGAQPGPRGGYEDAIVQRMVAGAATAYDVVWRWFRREVTNPEAEVFTLAKQEMVTCRLAELEVNARTGVSGLLLGKSRIEPLPERINATWTQFQQFQAGWESFRRNDPALADRLLETCRKAIRARQDTD